MEEMSENRNDSGKNGKKTDKLVVALVAGGIAVAAIVIIIIVFALKGGPEETDLDLVSNITDEDITITEVDGVLKADWNDDYLRFKIDYDGDDEKVEDFIESVKYNVTVADDKVNITAEYDKAKAEEAGVTVTADSWTLNIDTSVYMKDEEEKKEEKTEEEPEKEDADDEEDDTSSINSDIFDDNDYEEEPDPDEDFE